MPRPAPCLLLVFFLFALAQSSSEHGDRICHYPAPGAAVEFVYLITSVQSVFAAGSLPPNAISFHLHLPSHNEDRSCSCCFGLQNDNSVLQGMRQQGSSSSRLQRARTDDARRLRSSMRNLLWSKAAATIGAAARYVKPFPQCVNVTSCAGTSSCWTRHLACLISLRWSSSRAGCCFNLLLSESRFILATCATRTRPILQVFSV